MFEITNFQIEFNSDYHLDKGIEQPLTFAIGFRQYMHYHLHAIKQQLHTKMRNRVVAFERVITMARREKEDAKNWKENWGGKTHEEEELKEESKGGEVFRHK